MLWHAVAQQEGRALAFIVAEIRPVLRIADQSCQFRREAACDSWRICQPLIFIWLEPSEIVTDDNHPPHIGRDVRAGTMRGGTEEADGGARRKNRSEEHTSEIKYLMRISLAVFCWNKKKDEK